MSTTSASHADAPVAATTGPKVLVWDAPVRVFHWLMVFSFAGAYITAESERWRLLHVTLGYTMAGLVVFRILWGLVGTRCARFANFVRGPAAVLQYLRALLRRQPEHYAGHNPAGALAIVALLALTLLVTATGWAALNEIAGKWFEEAHEVVSNLMLLIVIVHIAAVLLSSWLHHENLIGAMITGRKPGRPDEAVASAWRSVAVLVLVAVLGFWWFEWQSAPAGGGLADAPAATVKHKDKNDD